MELKLMLPFIVVNDVKLEDLPLLVLALGVLNPDGEVLKSS